MELVVLPEKSKQEEGIRKRHPDEPIVQSPRVGTPDYFYHYAANFHERMVGLTGSPEQVKSASTAYRTYYRKQEGDDPDYYLMDHSTFSYLMFPDVGLVEFFRNDIGPEKMADQMACFVEAAA